MKLNRVVITGCGVVSPFGYGVQPLMDGIHKKKSAIRFMEEWDKCAGMRSHIAAPAKIENEKKIPRQKRRSMSPMSIFAVQASEQALVDAKIKKTKTYPERIGCVIGSTMGSAINIKNMFETLIVGKDISMLQATTFFRCMSHTAAMNVSQHLELNGYVMATSAACASSLQAIGTGYNLISLGKQDVLLCGGAEEIHPSVTGTFDILYATSTNYNQTPQSTPRPFDSERDGLVCGEGSGILVLESYEHARNRNAKIYAEIVGYNTCGNGVHICQSDKESMVFCMKEALSDAKMTIHDVDYINAHATGTLQGDKEEAETIKEVFGDSVPVSSLKGYLGHTMGASGAIELIASLSMMEERVIYPGLNLENVSDDCKGINHIVEPIKKELNVIVKNCFAFGGINASLVVKKL
jgi:3-oxoacyl-[acyl-carrier-protein] synthase II